MIRAFYLKEGELLHLDCESLVFIICSRTKLKSFDFHTISEFETGRYNFRALGPNDLKNGHLGQVCALCTLFYQTLHAALDYIVVLIISCETKCHIMIISNHQIYHLKGHD